MKILQLTKKLIAPIKDGESLAIHTLSRGLVDQGCEITLLALNTKKHYSKAKFSHPDLEHYKEVHSIDINTDIKPAAALLYFIYRKSYNIARYYSEEYENKLIQLLKNNDFDYIILETLYMSAYAETIRRNSNTKIVLRSHNLEYEIWSDLSKKTEGFKGWYYSHCASRLLDYEKKKFKTYDLLLSISSTDAKKYKDLGYKGDHLSIPVGLDLNKYQKFKSDCKQIKKLGYIGSLDWKPNTEGLDWFFKEVWFELLDVFPEIEFHLAGRNPNRNASYGRLKNTFYQGEIDSALEFISELDVVVVPLLSGSGIRVKILESLAMSKIVFATPKGLEGIDYVNKKDLCVFNNTQELISGLKELMDNQEARLNIQSNAMNLVKKNFSSEVLSERLVSKLKSLN